MERGYSGADNYSNPASADEFLARHYDDQPVREYVAVPPVDLSERRSEQAVELSGDGLDRLMFGMGLED